jgi:hypothetical protein
MTWSRQNPVGVKSRLPPPPRPQCCAPRPRPGSQRGSLPKGRERWWRRRELRRQVPRRGHRFSGAGEVRCRKWGRPSAPKQPALAARRRRLPLRRGRSRRVVRRARGRRPPPRSRPRPAPRTATRCAPSYYHAELSVFCDIHSFGLFEKFIASHLRCSDCFPWKLETMKLYWVLHIMFFWGTMISLIMT